METRINCGEIAQICTYVFFMQMFMKDLGFMLNTFIATGETNKQESNKLPEAVKRYHFSQHSFTVQSGF